MPESDFIEFGDSGLIPILDGWFVNKATGDKISPDGRVFNSNGDLIHDPSKVDEDDSDDKE